MVVGLVLPASNVPSAGLTLPDDAAAEVVKLASMLSQAFVKADAETITRSLAGDQIAVLDHGAPETQADRIEKLTDLKFANAALQGVKPVRISADAVAVSFGLLRTGTFRGKPLAPSASVIAVCAKRDGQWQQVTYPETLPEKQ